MGNIIKAVFSGDKRSFQTEPLYQYDYGQILIIEGIELPQAYEVHFGNSLEGSSTTSIGSADGVVIPDIYLTTGKYVYAWLYLHTGEDDGETVYHIVIPVRPRAKITNQQPTPVQQDVITETIAALNAAVGEAEQIAESIPETVNTALEQAKESGEFDGEDGFSPVVEVSAIPGGYRVSITDATGTHTADIMNGQPGQPGDDGYSPTVTITNITGGHRITITDKTGDHTADVMDGKDGDPGDLIDDEAGLGDTGKTFSANKLTQDHSALLTAINSRLNSDQLVTSISSQSTDTQIPSAKCVYDIIGDVETLLAAI